METVRCPRCNKLLRADTQSCGRCGAVLGARKPLRKQSDGDASSLSMSSQSSQPLASPHRAGHYSGLHPEDEPFQSSFFVRFQRPPEPLAETDTPSTVLELEMEPEWPAPQQTSWPAPPQEAPEVEQRAEYAPVLKVLADTSTLPPGYAPITPVPEAPRPALPRRSAGKTRVASLLISGSLICFLVASSLLAFLLLNKSHASQVGPQLLALPGELRVGDTLQLQGSGFDAHHAVTLVRDTQTAVLDSQGERIVAATDAQGTFQVHIPITAAWSIGAHTLQATAGKLTASTGLTIQPAIVGPPRLQLGVSRIDLGAGNPGTLAHKNLTLSNAGGGRVTWTAKSSVAWLSLDPSSGSFAGNAVVALTVNRAGLAPQAYLGQIVFTQDQSSSQTLYISMTVNTTPANLVLSAASLAFAGSPAQSPTGQRMVIQNSGGQTLSWTAGSTTSAGTNWLSVTPSSGVLGSNTSETLTVNVDTVGMAVGSYQGALNFSYAGGAVQQIAVSLTVSPPPEPIMGIAPQSLSFTTNQGFNPAPKSFTIANTGNAPLNWSIHADAKGQVFLSVSPASGSVPPGQSATVSIAPLLGSANGTINSTLTIQDSDPNSTVASQQVSVSIAITNQPVITLLTNNLEFDHDSTFIDTSELLIFGNTGSLALNWTLTESAQVPWLSFDSTSGTQAADSATFINLECTSSQMKPGTYTVTLTLKDSDANTVVAPQTVTITLIVS